MRRSSPAQRLRSLQERYRSDCRTKWTMQVWLTACGKTASIASGKPVSPSVQTKSTSLTPRLRSSVMTRVQKDDYVQLLERPALPGPDVVLDRGSHLRDQPVGDVDAVQLAQMPLDLPGRHPARVEREDLLVEAVERPRVLGHDPRDRKSTRLKSSHVKI